MGLPLGRCSGHTPLPAWPRASVSGRAAPPFGKRWGTASPVRTNRVAPDTVQNAMGERVRAHVGCRRMCWGARPASAPARCLQTQPAQSTRVGTKQSSVMLSTPACQRSAAHFPRRVASGVWQSPARRRVGKMAARELASEERRWRSNLAEIAPPCCGELHWHWGWKLAITHGCRQSMCNTFSRLFPWPYGLMDKALVFETTDSRFES